MVVQEYWTQGHSGRRIQKMAMCFLDLNRSVHNTVATRRNRRIFSKIDAGVSKHHRWSAHVIAERAIPAAHALLRFTILECLTFGCEGQKGSIDLDTLMHFLDSNYHEGHVKSAFQCGFFRPHLSTDRLAPVFTIGCSHFSGESIFPPPHSTAGFATVTTMRAAMWSIHTLAMPSEALC